MSDDTRKILSKIIIDIILLCFVGFPILFYFLWGSSYKRGFFCDDESLKHPFKESTVKSWMLYLYGIVLPTLAIVLTEFFRCRRKGDTRRYRLFDMSIPDWISNSYNNIGIFGFGAAATQLVVDIAKYQIGRYRPHFINLCNPRFEDGSTCDNPKNLGIYHENFTCANPDITTRQEKEMRLSFPSGHSSFSAYTMVYCAIYLHARMNWQGSKLLKHFFQYLLLLITWYTCLSRISDYKHHWSDVLAGASLGVIGALITSQFISDLFAKYKSSMLPTTRVSNDRPDHVYRVP
ncbi:putative phosphatidate phosphatase [Culicoides brevitarsis]|uniref:putative phosphatidate phosphatase n=1 Tax=Culicoides brevitarsis TaxID=469753 RepID=UPI00307C54EC